MKFSQILKKVISSTLVLTFSYTQLLWAGPRDMMTQSKAFFDEEAQRRGMSADEFVSQSPNQSAVDRQNLLEAMSGPVTTNTTSNSTNTFSLTTQNGDILKYVGDTLSQVKRPDGTLLNITDFSNGIIQGANLEFTDGSLQLFQNGKIKNYTTPDGTLVEYDPSTGEITQTTKDNVITTYTKVGEDLVLENPSFKTTYDSNHKLKQVEDKTKHTTTLYTNGLLETIIKQNGTQILFKQEVIGDQTQVSFKDYVDAQGHSFLDVTQMTLPDGSTLRDIVWNNETDKATGGILDSIDGNAYTFLNNVISTIAIPGARPRLPDGGQVPDGQSSVLSNITWDGDLFKGGHLKDPNNNAFDYQNGLLSVITDSSGNVFAFENGSISRIQLKDSFLIEDIAWNEPSGTLKNALLSKDGNKIHYVNSTVTSIDFSDGSTLTETVFNNGELVGGLLTRGSTQYRFEDRKLTRIIFSGNIFTVEGGVITAVTTPEGVWRDITWNNDHIQDALLTDSQGNKFHYLNAALSWIDLDGGVRLESLTWVAGRLQGALLKDSGNEFTFENGQITKIKLQDGSLIQGIGWSTADRTVKDAVITVGSDQFTYVNKILKSSVISGKVVEYKYLPGKIQVLSQGITFEYLLDNTLSKVINLDKSYATYNLTGPYKGYKDKEYTAGNVITAFYEYRPSPGGLLQAKKVVTSAVSTALGSGSFERVEFKFKTTAPQNNKLVLQATQSIVGNVTRSFTLTYLNGRWTLQYRDKRGSTNLDPVITYLNQPLVSGKDYVADLEYSSSKLNLFVYEKGTPYPLSPTASLDLFSPQSTTTIKFLSPAFTNTQPGSTTKVFKQTQSPEVSTLKGPLLTDKIDTLKNLTLIKRDIPSVTQKNISLVIKPDLSAAPTGIPVFAGLKEALSTRNVTLNVSVPVFSVTRKTLDVSKPVVELPEEAKKFEEILYNQDATLKEVHQNDGTTLFFENGLLTRAEKDGSEIDFGFTESSGLLNLTGSAITQNGLVSNFSEEGKLASVDTGTFTIHYKNDSNEIDFIEKTDGTEIYALPDRPLFDAAGQISNALFVMSDGEERTYEDGKLTHLVKPDKTEISYRLNEISHEVELSQLITPSDLTYNFSYETADVIEANLVAPAIPNALDMTRMTYDRQLNLKSALRQNKEILSYLDHSRLDTIGELTPEGTTRVKQRFTYSEDLKIASVQEGPSETFYDDNGQPTKTLISSTAENPHALKIVYQYGKVRTIDKGNIRTFEYSYSFDPQGKEITTIEDLEENSKKIYKEGLLESSLDKTNNVLSEYLYDENEEVSRVEVKRFERIIHTYHYTYMDGKTVVEDRDEGVTRTYGDTELKTYTLKEESVKDKDGNVLAYTLKELPDPAAGNIKQKLLTIQKDKTLYAYSYSKNKTIGRDQNETLSQEMVKEEMIQKTLEDGSVSHFENGKLKRVDLSGPERSYLTDIVLDSKNNLQSAAKHFSDGSKKVFGPAGLLEEVTADNTHLYYTNNRVTKVVDSAGQESVYSYETDPATGEVTTIWLEKPDGKLKYDLTGNLLGFSSDRAYYSLETQKNAGGQVTGYSLSGHLGKFYFDQDGRYVSAERLNLDEDLKTFLDASGNSNAVTAFLGAELSSDSAFGNAAVEFRGSGNPNNDSLVIADSESLDFGRGDFTLETRVKFDSFGDNQMIFSRNRGEGEGSYEVCYVHYKRILNLNFSGSVFKLESWSPEIGQWYHLAVVRKKGLVHIYVNGVELGTGTQDSHNIIGSHPLHLGGDVACNWGVDGKMDEVRISDLARYDGSFTPTVQEFVPDEHTRVLLHMNDENKTAFEKAKTLAQGLSGSLGSLKKFNHLPKMNFDAALKDGLVGTYRFGELKEILDPQQNLRFTFKNSELSTITDSAGRVLTYDFDKDPSGRIQKIRLDNGLVKLKYDSTGKLQGFKRDGYFDLEEVKSQTEDVYEGGFVTGYLSTDGDFETVQYDHVGHSSGAAGTAVSEHRFPGPQTVTSVTFKMSAFGRAGGNYHKDYEAYYYVEVLKNGAWEQVPGSFGGTYKVTKNYTPGDIGGTFNSGLVTLNNLNIQNVEAIRAHAHGYGNSDDNANADGSASIYEIQWTLADTANYSFSRVGDTFKFEGHEGTLLFDSEGDPQGQVPSGLQGVSDSLSGVVATYEELPHKDLMLLGVEHVFSPDLMALLKPVQAALPDSETVIMQEYSSSGILETQTKGDATVTLFDEENRPSQMLDADGKLLIQYFYDAQGHPSRVYLKNARDTLPGEVSKSKRVIEEQRSAALKDLAVQKRLAYTQIETAANAQKESLNSNLVILDGQRTSVGDTEVKGKQAKAQKSGILNQIDAAQENVQALLTQTNRWEADSYAKLNAQVEEVSDQIKKDSQKAFDEIAKQEASAKKDILKQEVSPIVYDNYRRILGRDPSTQEYDDWIDKVDYDSGNILTGEERTELRSGASITFEGNGNPGQDDDHLTVNASEDFDFGTGDYTIETWTRLDSIGENIAFFSRNRGDGQGGYQLTYSNPNKQLIWQQNGPVSKRESWNPEIERWYHLAVVRSADFVRFYVDGKELGSATAGAGDITGSTNLDIGADLAGNWGLDGRLEGFRVSKGKARYSGNFDPSTVQFAPDAYTKLLLGFNKEKDSVRDLSDSHRFIYASGRVGIDKNESKTQIPVRVPVIQYDPSITNIITGYDETTQTNPGASILFDGSGDQLVIPSGADFNFGTGDFTIDFWTKFNPASGDQFFISKKSASTGFRVGYNSYGGGYLDVDIAGNSAIHNVWHPGADTWIHIAIVRHNSTIYSFVNGAQLGSTGNDSTNIVDTHPLYIGSVGGAAFLNGRLDELRVSKGFARWTEGFTPSTVRYTPDTYTKLLLRANDTKDSLRDLSDSHYFVGASGNVSIDKTDYKAQEKIVTRTPRTESFIPALQTHLKGLAELGERRAFVTTVQQNVENKVNAYLDKTEEEKAAYASSELGLSSSEIIKLSREDAANIITWLKGERDAQGNPVNLHFGQSAFLALESLLDQKGISYAREDIATKAILIDILAGVITPMDEGDLVLSVFALNKVASLYGLTLSGAKLTWEDLKTIYANNPQARIIAHINGNHYVVITSITNDTITYIDPGIGKDKQNESLTIRKAGFLKAWRGNVTAETTILNSVISSPQHAGERSRFLTLQETLVIRGAFWGSILNLAAFVVSIAVFVINPALGSVLFNTLNGIMTGLRIAAFAVSIVEGDWISAISAGISLGSGLGDLGNSAMEGLKGAFHGVAQALGPLGQVLNGVGQVLNGVGTVLSNVYQGVTGFFSGFTKTLGAFANGLPKIAGELVKTAVAVGVNFGVSKGLEVIGVNPQVAGFLGSLAQGAIVGGMEGTTTSEVNGVSKTITQAQHIQSSIQEVVTLTQIGQLGTELGLNNTFTNIIGLSLAAIQGQAIQVPQGELFNIATAFSNIKPMLFSSLAQYGVTELGEMAGLDPRMASAIGTTVGTTIGQGITTGNIFGQGIVNVLNESIRGGFIAAGTQLLMNKLPDNIGTSFLTSVLASSFNKLINPKAPTNIVDAFLSSLKDLGQKLLAPETLNNLAQAIKTKGLKDALETHAQDVFQRSTIVSMVNAGGTIADFVGSRLAYASETVFKGQQAMKLDLSTSQADLKVYYKDTPTDGLKFLGYEENEGFAALTNSGPTLLSADIGRYYDGNTILTEEVRGGKTTKWEIRDKASNDLLLEIAPGTEGNFGSIKNFFQNSTLTFGNDNRLDFAITLPDGLKLSSPLTDLSNLSPEKQKALTSYVLLNGIANQRAAGVSPDSMINFKNGLRNEGVNERQVALFPLYENDNWIDDALEILIPYNFNNIIDDGGIWILDELGANIVTNKVKRMLDNQFAGLTPEERAEGIVVFAHSGGFNPLLRALDQKDYNVKAIVTYEGPSLRGIFTPATTSNTHLERVIKIRGTNDPWIPFAESSFTFSTVQSFNIQVEGAGHGDFEYSEAKWENVQYGGKTAEQAAWLKARDMEINRKTAIFNQKVMKAAGDELDWTDFLASIKEGIEYDSTKKVYNVKPLKLRYQGE